MEEQEKIYRVRVNPDCETITFWDEFKRLYQAPILPSEWYATDEAIASYTKLKGWHNPDAPIGAKEPLIFEYVGTFADIIAAKKRKVRKTRKRR